MAIDWTHFRSECTVTAPGRINIIGEHTDYNLGYVLPAAIEQHLEFRFRARTDTQCHVYSAAFHETLAFDLTELKTCDLFWEKYVFGVLNEIQQRGKQIKGFDCRIEGSIPPGAGISSSAAFSAGLAFGLNSLFDLQLSRLAMAQLVQDSENKYVGTQCGIMDPFACLMGKAQHAILLDCQSLEYQYVPLQLEPYELVLLNTNISRQLASSAYNTRRKECQEGLAILQEEWHKLKSLRDVTKEQLVEVSKRMSVRVYQRCRYVITENERVLAAVKAVKEGDLQSLGQLLYATHEGLKKEYEVSCEELDFLVAYARSNTAVLGARLMGGGFGGCTLNLVHKDATQEYLSNISKAYAKQYGIQLSPIQVTPANGVSLKTP